MGKINSQAKGKRAEREVAKLINRYLGTNVRRTPQSGGMSIKGDIIDINPDSAAYQFHFEVKDQKKLMIPKWWEQIDDDCPLAKTPVNVFKMNAQFYATMQFTDWLSLLAEMEELKQKITDLQIRNSEDKIDNDS
jgi:Holliday junction resolvase